MSTHDCLNNEDQLDSVLDEVAQIDSEFDSVSDIDSDLEKVVEIVLAQFENIYVNNEKIEPDENKNVNIEIPTTTSGFANDGDGTSPFATEKYVELYGGKIDSISIDGVNQTIDENKNVDLKGLASTKFVEDKIQKVIGLAPETLDTLEEIAKELGENESALEFLQDAINKLDNTYATDEALLELDSKVTELLGDTSRNVDEKISQLESSLNTSIDDVRDSIQYYSAGEGIDIDTENKISLAPSTKQTFGGLRVWEDEDGYLCFSTELFYGFVNTFEGGILEMLGAYNATLNNVTLVLE